MSSSPEFTVEQLASARATAWHQAGEPLLTLDAVRDWLTASGIVLFAPRPLQLPAPAPSLVEANLGASSAGPTDGQIATTRSLIARLVAEGNALPLNLLGTLGELPDFVVSAQVFSFIYTLRGDKAWKQPPATTGATKSSPLGVRIFEVLTEKGALTAAELASELGRELTESAVQRALTELWSNLRVIPLLSQSGGSAMWELTSRRFTKAIKAGINAGQPTALSALISLYLAQSLLATEEEIEIFLSPLAARSRIREVTHALTNSRQIETIVLEGKSLLHIPGTLPEFPAIEKPEAEEESETSEPLVEGEGRIKRFTSRSEGRTIGDFKGKPARAFSPGGMKPTPRFAAKPDTERRPFQRNTAESEKPSFTKPWQEDRKPRAPRTEGESPAAKRPYTPRTTGDGPAAKRPYTPRAANSGSSFAKKPYKPRDASSTGDRPTRPARPAFGDKPKFGDKPAYRKTSGEGFSAKPRFAAKDGDRKPFARKPYTPRDASSTSDRPARPARPAFGDKPKFGSKPAGDTPQQFRKFDAPKRSFSPRGGRPDKPAYGGSNSKPRAPREEAQPRFDALSRAPKRPFPRKPGDLSDRPVRPWQEAKPGRADGRPGGFGSKPRKNFGSRDSSAGRPSFGAKRSFGDRPKPPFRSASGDAPRPRNASGGFSKRPAGGDTVPFDSKPAVPRRPTGTKPPFPRPRKTEPKE